MSLPRRARKKRKFTFDRASFPGSIAVLPDDPLRVDGRLGSTDVYFHSVDEDLSLAYGDAVGSFVEFFSGEFGAPYTASLAVVEVDESAPTGYSAPGIIFLSPFGDRSRSEPSVAGRSGSAPMVESHSVPGEPQPHMA